MFSIHYSQQFITACFRITEAKCGLIQVGEDEVPVGVRYIIHQNQSILCKFWHCKNSGSFYCVRFVGIPDGVSTFAVGNCYGESCFEVCRWDGYVEVSGLFCVELDGRVADESY